MTKPRIISLYTGAGGLDLGFEAAGFETVAAVEFDHDCCETVRANRTAWNIIERSIFDVSSSELLEVGGLRRGDVDLLSGGPPCQPFSKSGYWARGDSLRLEDPRASTLAAYLRVLRDVRPRAFLLENVEGLAYRGKDEGLQLLLDTVRRINKETGSNYTPQMQVLSAADYGVPQLRERVFIVAARDGSRFRFPAPTHSPQPMIGSEPYRTAWDVLADVVPEEDEDLEVKGKWARLLPSIPEGHNYLWHTDRMGGEPLFGWRRRYWSFLLKLAKDKPSWTIQAQPGPAVGPFHWENRRLSMRELCRIQTFPDHLILTGGRQAIQRQAGNAVPSLLAEVLGREIRVQILGLPRLRGEPKLLPNRRAPIPPPSRTFPVDREYLRLRGKHQPHPGTGQGFGAVARARATG
jgi:DNA (cytosine-5)-methyltransferase 1